MLLLATWLYLTATQAQAQIADTLHTSAESGQVEDSLNLKEKMGKFLGKFKQTAKIVVGKVWDELEAAWAEFTEDRKEGVGKKRRAWDEHKDVNKCDCDPKVVL